MEIKYAAAANLEIQFDAKSAEDIFESLASLQEVFGYELCGLCHGDTIFTKRTAESKDKGECVFYEKKCLKCHAKLEFGMSMENKGEMYPKRKMNAEGKPCKKGEEGTYGEGNGWFRYKSTTAKK